MTISVIIPTYNGAHKIMTALRALENQLLPPDEVIVVIDGSTDNTAVLLNQSTFSFSSFRVVLQENKGRGAVRNRGAEEATQSLLVFLDDDMLPEPGWLQAHHAHHKQHPGSIMTSAGIDMEDVAPENDFQKFKVALSMRWKDDLHPFNRKPFPAEKAFITAANFSLTKQTFEKVGGFNAALNDVEDYDFAVRATLQQIPIFYDEAASAWHIEKASCAHSIRRMRSYNASRKVLLETNPEIYGKLLQQQRPGQRLLKNKLFGLFCHTFWIRSIDSNSWTWLPKNIRYKLYDVVVTANASVSPDKVRL